jgi:probable HAF family extracellular repeat protein
VSGISAIRGSQWGHAFIWTKQEGMVDLATLPGDKQSAGLFINNHAQVVGPSLDENYNPTAYLYENGSMYNLNSLVVGDAPLYLLLAAGINDAGQIVGFGVDAAGDVHGFLATPCEPQENDRAEEKPKVQLSDYPRATIRKYVWPKYPANVAAH